MPRRSHLHLIGVNERGSHLCLGVIYASDTGTFLWRMDKAISLICTQLEYCMDVNVIPEWNSAWSGFKAYLKWKFLYSSYV